MTGIDLAEAIIRHAVPVLTVKGMTEPWWTRNVRPGDRRIGPWLTAVYDVLDRDTWKRRGPCIYVVLGRDGRVRYVGRVHYALTDRWRLSPAYVPDTRERLPDRRLFHGQCWPHMTAQYAADPTARFEVRVVDAAALAALTGSERSRVDLVTRVERELIGQRSDAFAPWNGRQPCP